MVSLHIAMTARYRSTGKQRSRCYEWICKEAGRQLPGKLCLCRGRQQQQEKEGSMLLSGQKSPMSSEVTFPTGSGFSFAQTAGSSAHQNKCLSLQLSVVRFAPGAGRWLPGPAVATHPRAQGVLAGATHTTQLGPEGGLMARAAGQAPGAPSSERQGDTRRCRGTASAARGCPSGAGHVRRALATRLLPIPLAP